MSAGRSHSCEVVWSLDGAEVVVACTRCPRVLRRFPAGPGDAERVAQSQAAYREHASRS